MVKSNDSGGGEKFDGRIWRKLSASALIIGSLKGLGWNCSEIFGSFEEWKFGRFLI